MLEDYALRQNFHIMSCVYVRACVVLSQSWKDQSKEDAHRRRRERERERRARETPEQREARLYSLARLVNTVLSFVVLAFALRVHILV